MKKPRNYIIIVNHKQFAIWRYKIILTQETSFYRGKLWKNIQICILLINVHTESNSTYDQQQQASLWTISLFVGLNRKWTTQGCVLYTVIFSVHTYCDCWIWGVLDQQNGFRKEGYKNRSHLSNMFPLCFKLSRLVIIDDFETLSSISEISRIDSNFLKGFCYYHGNLGLEMNVGHQRYIISAEYRNWSYFSRGDTLIDAQCFQTISKAQGDAKTNWRLWYWPSLDKKWMTTRMKRQFQNMWAYGIWHCFCERRDWKTFQVKKRRSILWFKSLQRDEGSVSKKDFYPNLQQDSLRE